MWCQGTQPWPALQLPASLWGLPRPTPVQSYKLAVPSELGRSTVLPALHLYLHLLCGPSTLLLLFRTHPLSFEAPPCAFFAFSLAAGDTVSRQGQSHLGLGLGPEVKVWQGFGSKGKLQGTWGPWECVLAPCLCPSLWVHWASPRAGMLT